MKQSRGDIGLGSSGASTGASEASVLSGPGVLLGFITAPWLAVCAAQEAELAGLMSGSYRIVEVDISHAPELARRLGVVSVPTLIVMCDGMELERFTGLQPAAIMSGALRRALGMVAGNEKEHGEA